MGINLQKGQKIDLSKGGAGGPGLRRVMVGLGWASPYVLNHGNNVQKQKTISTS